MKLLRTYKFEKKICKLDGDWKLSRSSRCWKIQINMIIRDDYLLYVFFFFLNFINRTRMQFYFRYAVRPIFLAKRYAQIRKLKRKNGHNHLSPQTNFNRQKSIIIWRVCVINPWQSSGRIAISTRVLQNLNQFTLKNHEKLNKLDIWR